jgi:dTDP-glucose pyrophosphorylase
MQLLKEYRKLIIKEDSTIKNLIECIELMHSKLAIVVSDNDLLIGTISDGDIRRALLKGLTIDDKIDKLINKNCIHVEVNKEHLASDLMIKYKIDKIPIIDKNNKLIGCYTSILTNNYPLLENIFFIMAGGKGVRMRPYTENCPKPLLPILGKPMILHIIEKAKFYGFVKFIISIGYLGEMIQDYLEDGSKFGIHIEYIKEEVPLGTAGALGLIKEIPALPFIVTNCDVISTINYHDILLHHRNNNAEATVAIKNYQIQNPFGVVVTNENKIVGFEEKPIYHSLINAGVYIFNPKVIELIDKGLPIQMPEFLLTIKDKFNLLNAYLLHEKWNDIGNIHEYNKINE